MATTVNIQQQLRGSTSPQSILITDSSSVPSYFAPTTGSDTILFYDDSASAWTALSIGANLAITGTTLDVTISSVYDTVQEEGTPVGAGNTILNFIGAGFTAADAGAGVTSITLDATLNSLATYNTNGILTQTAADTFVGRTISGTTNRISVTDGDGVAANPSIDISVSYVGQSSITTLGTITTGTWSATTIAADKGGTGTSSYTIGDILYADSTSTLAKLAIGASNTYLKGGTTPSWTTISSSSLTDSSNIALLNGNQTFTGNNVFSNNITISGTPSASTDAATVGFVTTAIGTAIAGIRHTSVRVATTAALTLSTDFENGDTIDGVTLVTGDLVLIKNQASSAENGIYTVNASGAPTRATWMDSASEIDGVFVVVEDGTTNAGTFWVTVSDVTTLNTDPIVFTQVDVAITASNGLTKTGNDITLGGSLTAGTFINAGSSYYIEVDSSSTSNTIGAFRVDNSAQGLAARIISQGRGLLVSSANNWNAITASASGSGIAGTFDVTANFGVAVYGTAHGGSAATGVWGDSDTGTSLYGSTLTGTPLALQANPSSTNTVVKTVQLDRRTSSTAADGIGQSLDFLIETTAGSSQTANQIISKWTTATNASRTSQLILTGVNSAVTADLLTLSGSGALKLNKYGVSTFTGTPAYNLAVDSSGNIIESAIPSTITASNGLTKVVNDIQLGGTLTSTTTINRNGNGLYIPSNNLSELYLDNEFFYLYTYKSANRYTQIENFASDTEASNYMLLRAGYDSNQNTVTLKTTTTDFAVQTTATNTVVPIFKLSNTSSGTAAIGLGSSIDFWVETSSGSPRPSNQIISKWTNVTDASRTSDFVITGSNSAVVADLLTLGGSGSLKLNKYGISTFTGTPAYNLAVDSSGNVIESAIPGTITASNGLTKTGNNIALGGTGTADTTIAWSNFFFANTFDTLAGSGFKITSTSTAAASNAQRLLDISLSGANATSTQTTNAAYILNSHTGTSALNYGLSAEVQNGTNSSAALRGIATSQRAVYGDATTGTAIYANVTSGTAGFFNATSGKAIDASVTGSNAVATFGKNTSTTNAVVPMVQINTSTSGTAAAGFGGAIDTYVEANDGSLPNALRIAAVVSDATAATFTSKMEISLENSNTLTKNLTLAGSGQLTLHKYGINTFAGTPAYSIGVDASGNLVEFTSAAGGGTVTDFSAGDLSPLFTTTETNTTTTPALTFTLSNAAANTWFGNNTGSSAAPAYNNAGALTKTDDTNVTLTLGGSPTTALLNATSLTLGWTGTLAATRGGTGTGTVATGDLLYGSAANVWSKLAAGTNGQFLKQAAGIPSWSGIVVGDVASGTFPTAFSATLTAASTASFKYNGGNNAIYMLDGAAGQVSLSTNDGSADITLGGSGVDLTTGGNARILLTADDINIYSNANVMNSLRLGPGLAPAQITADVNNYSPTDLLTSTTVYLDLDADHTITGLDNAGVDGAIVVLRNTSAFYLTLANESASSSAINRFSFGQDIIVAPLGGIILQYNANANRWYGLGTDGNGIYSGSGQINGTTNATLASGATMLFKYASTSTALGIEDTAGRVIAASGDGNNAVDINDTSGVYIYSAAEDASISLDTAAGVSVFSTANVNIEGVNVITTGYADFINGIALDSALSPTQITANQNNYNPTNLADTAFLRLDSNGAYDITGLAGGSAGRIMVVTNIGAFTLTLKNESASSTAGNRFALGADYALAAGKSLILLYDSGSVRWRTIGLGAASSGGSLSDADYGDITVSSSGTVWTIDNDVVTYAKMQNVSATNRILGRSTAGSGDVEEITVGGDLTQSGSSFTVVSASTSTAGKVELATISETNVGTDATRAVTPDSLSGSIYGAKIVKILVSDPLGSAITTGDGKAYIPIDNYLTGMNLVAVEASVSTVSSSGVVNVQVRRVRSGTPVDMLSTALTIDASEIDSNTAATPAVINTSNDDVSLSDQIYIDIDGAGTGAKGLCVTLVFQTP